ncbi:MAG: aspartate/glutamate racemase family protein [Victivallales bacterium]|nr:aspartate/glutamate racemase family protein [Victivallales bacterium]
MIKILVTDSGIGGVAFTAKLFELVKRERYFEKAEIIFFNCRPADNSGYVPLANDFRRAEVFSRALYAMAERFQPDRIIIACNTLSALYEMTEFAQSQPVPVTGIIEAGVSEIAGLLAAHPEMHMLLFATPVTVSSGVHKNRLDKREIDPGRLHYQACPGLPEAISRGARSGEVRKLIRQFMDEAGNRMAGEKFALSLLCTHFPYSLPFFAEFAACYSGFSGDILNPDSALADLFLRDCNSLRDLAGHSEPGIKCFTHSTVTPEMRRLMYPLLAEISPAVAAALLEMEHTSGMFRI